MEITINLSELIIGIIILIGTTAITFYLKDYLQSQQEYKQLRKKLERIAGKNAKILFDTGTGIGKGLQEFKIEDIDKLGITLKNDLQTIFVPSKKLLQTEMILPGDRYEQKKKEMIKKEMDSVLDAMIPGMFERMVPAMKDIIAQDMLEEEGEISVVLGMKIAKVLQEEGITKKGKLTE